MPILGITCPHKGISMGKLSKAPVMKKLVTEAPVPIYGIVGGREGNIKKVTQMPFFLFSAAKMIA